VQFFEADASRNARQAGRNHLRLVPLLGHRSTVPLLGHRRTVDAQIVGLMSSGVSQGKGTAHGMAFVTIKRQQYDACPSFGAPDLKDEVINDLWAHVPAPTRNSGATYVGSQRGVSQRDSHQSC
jgi:hypothetical protein